MAMHGLRSVRRAFEARAAAGVLLAAAAFCVACGGEKASGTGGGDEQEYDQCADAAALEQVLIGDFEAPAAPNWFTGYDNTPGAMLSPPVPVPAAGPATTPIDVPRCGPSGSALHVTASGLLGYGYSFGFNQFNTVVPNPDGVFDARGYTGISIWVRKGSQASGSTIFASVADRSTLPTGAAFFTGAERDSLLSTGGYCAFDVLDVTVPPDGVVDPLQSQCDRFGAGIGLGTEWRFYKIPFSKMRQRAYGRAAFDPQPDWRIMGLEFGLDGETWDLWIDDVAFYKEPAAAN